MKMRDVILGLFVMAPLIGAFSTAPSSEIEREVDVEYEGEEMCVEPAHCPHRGGGTHRYYYGPHGGRYYSNYYYYPYHYEYYYNADEGYYYYPYQDYYMYHYYNSGW